MRRVGGRNAVAFVALQCVLAGFTANSTYANTEVQDQHATATTSVSKRADGIVRTSLPSGAAVVAQTGITSQTQSEPTSVPHSGIEEIVVTARRRAETEQATPVAITAFSAQDIAERGIERADEMQFFVPSFFDTSFNRDAANSPTIRGLQGVTTYVADVPVSFISFTNGYGIAQNGLYTDLQNVQVLKGPQGTLFGQNSTGGAILFEPASPTDEFGGYLRGVTGNYAERQFEGAINTPLIGDELLSRFAMNWGARDGFTKDINTGVDYDNIDYIYGRGSLLWKPKSNFENFLYVDYYWSHNNGSGYELTEVVPNSLATFLYGQATLDHLLQQQKAIGPRETNASYDAFGLSPIRREENLKVIDRATLDLGDGWMLKNIASYQTFGDLERDSFDGVPFDLVKFVTPNGSWNTDKRRATEELQLDSHWFDNRLDLVSAVFFSHIEPGTNSPALFCFACDTGLGAISLLTNNIEYNTNFAVYTHGILDLTDVVQGLKFAAGFRHNWDATEDKDYGYIETSLNGPRICGNGLPGCLQELKGKWEANGWEVNLSDQLTADKLIYVRSGSAYTEGGFNADVWLAGAAPGSTPTAQQLASFQALLNSYLKYAPEKYTDVEIGYKGDATIAGRPLRTNVAVFYGMYNDIQRFVSIPVPAGLEIVNALGQVQANAYPTTNAASATVKGGELELDYIPWDQLTLSLGASYDDASYDKWMFAGENIAKYNQFPYFPAWHITGRAAYTLPLPPDIGALTASADAVYVGSQIFNLTTNTAPTPEDPNLAQKPYTLVNLRLDWTGIYGSNVDMSAYVENVANTLYLADAADARSSYGLVQGLYGLPRMFFVEARYHF
jgi:iron complex outermembrane receptor protein